MPSAPRSARIGGEFHIVKNTLAKLALEKAGYSVPADYAEKSTAIGFAFTDAAGFTKALTEATKGMEAVKIKGGFMDAEVLNCCPGQSPGHPAAAAGPARPIAGCPAGSRQQTGPHAGRTWPLAGIRGQGVFRQGCTCCGIISCSNDLSRYYSNKILFNRNLKEI